MHMGDVSLDLEDVAIDGEDVYLLQLGLWQWGHRSQPLLRREREIPSNASDGPCPACHSVGLHSRNIDHDTHADRLTRTLTLSSPRRTVR